LDRPTDLYASGQLIELYDVVKAVIAWVDEILAWQNTRRPPTVESEQPNTGSKCFAARGLLLT